MPMDCLTMPQPFGLFVCPRGPKIENPGSLLTGASTLLTYPGLRLYAKLLILIPFLSRRGVLS